MQHNKGFKLMTGICLTNESLYTNQDVRNYVLNNFEGILFAGERQGFEFYSQNKDKLKKSMSLNGSVMDENLRCYIDEPISNPKKDNKDLDGILKKFPNAIIGELEKDILLDLKKRFPSTSLTYTAYRELWFKIFGHRIYKWWKNQMNTWEWMNKNFGKIFNICWINLGQMDDKSLFDWAKIHNKEIWIYSEDTIEEFLTKILNS